MVDLVLWKYKCDSSLCLRWRYFVVCFRQRWGSAKMTITDWCWWQVQTVPDQDHCGLQSYSSLPSVSCLPDQTPISVSVSAELISGLTNLIILSIFIQTLHHSSLVGPAVWPVRAILCFFFFTETFTNWSLLSWPNSRKANFTTDCVSLNNLTELI